MYPAIFKIVFVISLLLSSTIVFAQAEEGKEKPAMVIPEEVPEVVNEDKKDVPVETLTGDPQIEEMVRNIRLYNLDLLMEQIGSLFFTSYELNLIIDARKGLIVRAPTNTEVKKSIKEQKEGRRPIKKGPREIFLGGIVYTSSEDWVVWLNGQKVSPDRLLPEILDIRVYKDFIKLKWFDAYTNQVFPIKIRTHQRFNIDTRIFLPG